MIMVPEAVMARLDPAIHGPEIADFDAAGSVDHRVKPADDDYD